MEKKNILKESLCLFLLLLIVILSNIIIKSNNSEDKVLNKIYSSLEKIQTKHDSISSDFQIDFENIIENPKKKFATDEENIPAIYIYKNDSLIYWNSNINDPQTLLRPRSRNFPIRPPCCLKPRRRLPRALTTAW